MHLKVVVVLPKTRQEIETGASIRNGTRLSVCIPGRTNTAIFAVGEIQNGRSAMSIR